MGLPQNKLGEAIIERISRAIIQKTPFRCYFFLTQPEELGTTAKVSLEDGFLSAD